MKEQAKYQKEKVTKYQAFVTFAALPIHLTQCAVIELWALSPPGASAAR